MKKTIMSIFIALLIVLLLLSLPFIYISISGIIIGSFEMFPNQGDVADYRLIWTFIVSVIVFVDIFLIIGLVKLIKSLRIN